MLVERLTKHTQVLDYYLKNKPYIYVTVISHEYKEMAYNWYLWLIKHDVSSNVIIFCLDDESYNYLSSKNVQIIRMDTDYMEGIVNEYKRDKPYEKFYPLACVMMCQYLTENYTTHLYLSDVDMIFLKPYREYMLYQMKEDNKGTCLFINKTRDDFLRCRSNIECYKRNGAPPPMFVTPKVLHNLCSVDDNLDSPLVDNVPLNFVDDCVFLDP